MKKRILYYAPMPSDATSFYRVAGVLPYITHQNFELTDVSGLKEFNWSIFSGVSTFIFQRPFAPEHINLLTLVKDMNIRVIVDYDDALLDVGEDNPTYFQYLHNQQNTIKCLNLADEVWVSTEFIKQSYSLHNPNIHVIPNAHNDFYYPVSEKLKFNHITKKVMYRGGGSHQADVNSVADDIIRVVNGNTDWDFLFMGDRFPYQEGRCGDNYKIVGGMTIFQYFKYLHFENPNIGIFPLCTTDFNRGKSNISWLEMTYAGAAFFGNTDLLEFEHAGVTPFSLLDKALDSMTRLERLNTLSWEHICDTLLLSNINKLRTERILNGI